jgi:hypothetical protein
MRLRSWGLSGVTEAQLDVDVSAIHSDLLHAVATRGTKIPDALFEDWIIADDLDHGSRLEPCDPVGQADQRHRTTTASYIDLDCHGVTTPIGVRARA